MAAMVYTLSMTSDVALFTATIRGGHGNQKLAKARKCHGLKIMDGVLDLPRKPSDAEHEAVLGRLTSALGAMPSDTDVQTWLGAELVAAIAAMKSASASAPSPRRTVAEPRKLAAGPGSALGGTQRTMPRSSSGPLSSKYSRAAVLLTTPSSATVGAS